MKWTFSDKQKWGAFFAGRPEPQEPLQTEWACMRWTFGSVLEIKITRNRKVEDEPEEIIGYLEEN